MELLEQERRRRKAAWLATAPGHPCPPHGWGAALLLVPYDEVEEVFVDVGLPGEQGAAQLFAAVAEGAGEVEIFIAARGTERAVSWGGGVSWGREAQGWGGWRC